MIRAGSVVTIGTGKRDWQVDELVSYHGEIHALMHRTDRPDVTTTAAVSRLNEFKTLVVTPRADG